MGPVLAPVRMGAGVRRDGAAVRRRGGVGTCGASRTTRAGGVAGEANAGRVDSGSGTASSRISFGNAIAPAPPSTASATVNARANVSLMQLPLGAENTPRGLIGSGAGN